MTIMEKYKHRTKPMHTLALHFFRIRNRKMCDAVQTAAPVCSSVVGTAEVEGLLPRRPKPIM